MFAVFCLRFIHGETFHQIKLDIFSNDFYILLKFELIALVILLVILVLGKVFKVNIEKIEKKKNVSLIFSSVFIFLIVWFLMLIVYVDAFFPNVNLNQLLFILTMPIKGTSASIISKMIVMLLCVPLFCSFFYFVLLKTNVYIVYGRAERKAIFPFHFVHKKLLLLSFVLMLLTFLSVKFQLIKSIKNELKENSTFYENNYIDAKNVTFEFPEVKKNLIFIYLESMEAEASYCAKKNENIIPELSLLAKNNLSFSQDDGIGGARQIAGTDHSIASVCSTHLGIPLVVDIMGAHLHSKYFFDGAFGLGNILKKAGYNCSFILGSESVFGSLDVLLSSHDFSCKDINYYKKIKKIPDDYYVWWGIEDTKLLEFAKDEILDLQAKNEPFAFSVFFEDTHASGGYYCSECENKWPKQIHNVFSCMSKRVYNFVNWIQMQPCYKDTVIVILGDHLYMGDDLYDEKRGSDKRHAYNVFINTGKTGEFNKNRAFCTFDYFPTIIDCLDIKYSEDGLGMGRSLLSGKPTLLEQLGFEKLEEGLTAKSKFYNQLFLNKHE